MTQRQRKMLSELMTTCNDLGSSLDLTATHPRKLIDRQMAHRLVYLVLYGVLSDDPENDQRDEDVSSAELALHKIKEISKINYPDRQGVE